MVLVGIRQAEPRDVEAIHGLQFIAYPEMSKVASWGKHHLESHQTVFARGQLVAVADDKVVGHTANLIVRSQIALAPHKYAAITGRGTFSTHDAKGDTLYGAEIMVHPDFRRQGVARQFYERRFQLAADLGLRYFLSGGRLPGYAEHRDTMKVEEYVAQVLRGELEDRTLSAQIAVGLCVRGVLPDYINDPKSSNAAALLAWENPALRNTTSPALCPSVWQTTDALALALRLNPSLPNVSAW